MTSNPEQRRVRKLRLTAPADGFFRRGEILLEDALRTASLPAGRGRLLLVRSLNVGKIRAGQSPAALALAIEQALGVLGAQAVHAAEPAAGEHRAVYFRDDAEPYISLAVKLARREKTDAWFWPLAVRAWKPEMSRDEAMRALLLAVLRTEAGACAAVAMIQELHRRRVSDHLLSALRRQDGATLLQAFGWSGPSPPRPPLTDDSAPGEERGRSPSRCPAQWSGALMRWTNHWGEDDSRSLWLAAFILVTEKPARLLGHSLIERARQLIRATRRPPAPRALHPSKLPADEPGVPAAAPQNRRARAREAAEKSSRRAETGAIDQARPATPHGRVAESTRAENPERFPELTTVSPRAKEPRVREAGGPELREQLLRAAGQTPAVNESPGIPNSTGRPAAAPARSTRNAPARIEEPPGTVEVPGDEQEKGARAADPWAACPRPSAYAGLFFLVPLMSRLGISTMLEANPRLIEIDLPQKVLHFVGRRLSVPDDDPALSFLSGEWGEHESSVNCEYSIPPSWLHKLCHKGPWTIRRLLGGRGARLLSDGSGRLALGLWRGRMPAAARTLLGGRALVRGSPAPFETDPSLLCRTWLTALRRWCRRYAGIGLHTLVCRPGRIAVTPTHVDILFDHRQAEIRIRQAGLDINPGWVAWLGRVFTYHYLYGEQIYGK